VLPSVAQRATALSPAGAGRQTAYEQPVTRPCWLNFNPPRSSLRSWRFKEG
jgi:hypothetical protein